MAPMNFDAYARRQAQVLFDTLADSLVKDLSNAAGEEARAAAAQARQEEEQAAEIALSAARAEGEARLAAAQAMNAGLLDSVEVAREEVRAVQAASEEELRTARAAAEEELRTARVVAQEELRTVQAAAQDELRTTQTAAQEELRTAQAAAQEELRATQAAAQKELRSTQVEAKERVRTTQAAAQAEIERVRVELEAQLREREQALDAALRDTGGASEAVERARQETIFARNQADACREDRALVIERVGTALSAIDRATTPSDILETLLEPLGHEFARAAVFLVGASSLNGWRARGLDSTTDIAKLVFLRANDSPLARAVTAQKPLYLTATPTEPLAGLLGPDPVTHAVALPVLAGQQVIAVAYAEDGDGTTTSTTRQGPLTPFPGDACKIAEMLIGHATLRLTSKRAPSAHPAPPGEVQPAVYSPARQARRLKVQKGIDVTLEGAESSLVDLSSIGAQILSPLAMPPNRLVKMTLRTKDSALACKGRVMWARFEQPSRSAAARYRVGVKFTDIEARALEGLMTRHGIAEAP